MVTSIGLALALVATRDPIGFERSLAETCGRQVLSQAHIEQHSDRQTLVYAGTLPDEQVKCLKDWAKTFGGEIVNGIDTYQSPDYPDGPYSIPHRLRRS